MSDILGIGEPSPSTERKIWIGGAVFWSLLGLFEIGFFIYILSEERAKHRHSITGPWVLDYHRLMLPAMQAWISILWVAICFLRLWILKEKLKAASSAEPKYSTPTES